MKNLAKAYDDRSMLRCWKKDLIFSNGKLNCLSGNCVGNLEGKEKVAKEKEKMGEEEET